MIAHEKGFRAEKDTSKGKIIRCTAWELLNPEGTLNILQIYWIYKDAIDLTSRWKVRFKQTFYQNKVQRVLYKLVLVTYSLVDHSRRINSPLNFRFIKFE